MLFNILNAFLPLAVVCVCLAQASFAQPTPAALQEYIRPDQATPLRKNEASLYACPWRARLRTASAFEALSGVGASWNGGITGDQLEPSVAFMSQLKAAGIARLRWSVHHGVYISAEWTTPNDGELKGLRTYLRACKAAGIRPSPSFVHIPPMGKPDTDELQKWWHEDWNEKEQKWRAVGWNTELLPVGDVGTPKFQAYLDKTYEALKWLLVEAREAGFTEKDSYDIELGYGLWWGAPARNKPLPSTNLTDLRPGGRIYEFERALIVRLRAEGFIEPTVYMGQTHHLFDEMPDEEVAPEAAGWAVTFHNQGIGAKSEEWFAASADRWPQRALGVDPQGMFAQAPLPGWGGDSPLYPPLSFREGEPPSMILARPEGWWSDRSRHENLLDVLQRTKKRVAIAGIGVGGIFGAAPEMDRSEIKTRALPRAAAFWLNQGVDYIIWHTGFENPNMTDKDKFDPATFRYQDSRPLMALRNLCDALQGAKPLEKREPLNFAFALSADPVLIPQSNGQGPQLLASDAIALLPFQIDEKTFAVAAYILTPNIAQPLEPIELTLKIDKRLTSTIPTTIKIQGGVKGEAQVLDRAADSTTVRFQISDEVTWLRFQLE